MIRLRVPGTLTYRHLALRVVAAACKMVAPKVAAGSVSLSEEEFEAQTVSAFGEAFNNIAIHGYRGGPPGDVDIEIESDEDGIVIQLVDTGQSFDPKAVVAPDIENLPESGMGLFIINSFMDEVDYRAGPPNVLRLVKRRDGGALLAHGGGGGAKEGAGGDPLAGLDDAAELDEESADHLENANTGFRIRSVSRSGAARAAGGIKIQ